MCLVPGGSVGRQVPFDKLRAGSPLGLKSSVGMTTRNGVYEYLPGDRRVEVTYLEGLVVRFSISSR